MYIFCFTRERTARSVEGDNLCQRLVLLIVDLVLKNYDIRTSDIGSKFINIVICLL